VTGGNVTGMEPAVDGDHGVVAVVDDDLAVLDSLKLLLELAGYPVAVYASAVEFLEVGAPPPACVVLDHHMPRMTGLELAERLRRDQPGLPIMLITANPSPAIIARARELGIERVLQKPPTEDDLLGFVGRYR
jgi:FixJ family two-component response regulator